MALDTPSTDLGSVANTPPPRRSGRLWLIAGVAAVVVLILLARPSWQRGNDLHLLEQAGAVFDTRTRTPKWMKLVGSTLNATAIDSLARVTTLEDLVLDESNVTDNDLAALVTLAELRRLSLVHTAVTDRGLSHLSGLPRLKTLVLDSSYRVTDDGLAAVGEIVSLEDVSLLDTPVTLPPLVALSGRHTTLQINSSHGVLGNRKLALSGTEISDEGLLRLHNAVELEGIELPSRITDRGLRHLHGLSKLKYLVFAGTRITDRGFGDLIDRSPPLTELDISGCRGLTDTGMALVARLPHLTHLQADNTDAGPKLLAAAAQLETLELLSLNECRSVNNNAFRLLLNTSPRNHLKFLRLSGTRVTDASLQSITPNQFPGLKGLDLRHTPTAATTIALLRKRLPDCRVLASPAPSGLETN